MDTNNQPQYNRDFSEPIVMGKVDYSNLPYIIGLFVFILSLLIFILWRKTKSARTDVLLAGLSDSGKTYLFSQLLFSEDKETFSSVTKNVGDLVTEQGSVRVVDIPGNERLRNRFMDEYKYLAKGIVYVVDSVTVQKDIRDVADFLYTILADSANENTSILIYCNKQDETMAKGSAVIKSLLEKELNVIRTTRANRLQSVDNSQKEEAILGKAGKDFEFAHLTQNVEVIEGSAKNRDLKHLNEWIRKI